MLKRIVVGYDFSDHADDALQWAVELARTLNAQVALTHVIDTRSDDDPAIESARARLVAMANDIGPEIVSHVLHGHAVAKALVHFADTSDADLLVIGTRGLGGVARILLGSVADTCRAARRPAPWSRSAMRIDPIRPPRTESPAAPYGQARMTSPEMPL